MNHPDPIGKERLLGAILGAARREAEALVVQAREKARTLAAQADGEARRLRNSRLAAARAEAERREAALEAAAKVESRRQQAVWLEALLRGIRDDARTQLHQPGAPRTDAFVRLAAEALARMEGNRFVLRVPRAEWAGVQGSVGEAIVRAAAAVRPGLELQLLADAGASEGEWILQDAEGHQMWRLGLDARLTRLWPELRSEVARRAGWLSQES